MLKNIVIIADETEITNGGADVAVNTAYQLAQRGFNVYYFSATGEKIDKPDEKLLSSPNIKIVALSQYPIKDNPNVFQAMYQGFYNFRAAKVLRDLLSTLNRDETVVHVHAYVKILSPSVLKAIIDMNFKMFITVHDYLLACPCSFLYNYPEQHVCEVEPMSMKCLFRRCDRRHYYHKVWKFFRNIIQNKILGINTYKGGVCRIYIYLRVLKERAAQKNTSSKKSIHAPESRASQDKIQS